MHFLAAKPARQIAALLLARTEEEIFSIEAITVVENDTFKFSVSPLQTRDALFMDGNTMTLQPFARVTGKFTGSIRAEHHIVTPDFQFECKLAASFGADTVNGYGLVPRLPTIAIGTMEYAATIQGFQTVDGGQCIGDPGGKQEFSREDTLEIPSPARSKINPR